MASNLSNIKFKGEFVDNNSYDKTSRSCFMLTISPNNRRTHLNEEQEQILINNFKKCLDPLFKDGLISLFFQADLNEYDVEHNKPFNDKNLWIDCFDENGNIKQDEEGNNLINIHDVESSYTIEFGSTVDHIHCHALVNVINDGNILINYSRLGKFVSNRWEKITGERKNISINGIKTADLVYKKLQYMRGQKEKVINKK